MNALVAVPLADGAWIALTQDELARALAKGQELGLGAPSHRHAQPPSPVPTVNSREMAAILGIASTTVEARAQRGDIPCIRIGKALRFVAADVLNKLKE